MFLSNFSTDPDFSKKVSGFGSWQSGIKIPEVQL